MDSRKKRPNRFMSWRDLVLTPLVWIISLMAPAWIIWSMNAIYGYGWPLSCLLFLIIMIVWTLLLTKIIRLVIPLKDGVYSLETNPWPLYAWNLIGFLSFTNLFFFHEISLLPPPFKKYFYRLMGAKIGNGVISIAGRLMDPYLVTLGENTMIGHQAMIHSHLISAGSSEILVLGSVDIKNGVVIGAGSVVMPGVVIGENSMVNPMSYVPMNTKIPPNEVWGGNPTTKVSDVSLD